VEVLCAGARESATAITLRGRRTSTRLPTHDPAMSLLVPSPTIAPITEARDSVGVKSQGETLNQDSGGLEGKNRNSLLLKQNT